MDRLTPINQAINKMRKFPMKPPKHGSDTTNASWVGVNGPAGNVLFSFFNSAELITGQPRAMPNESVNKLPNTVE